MNLRGKGGRVRRISFPEWVRLAIVDWLAATQIVQVAVFRRISRHGVKARIDLWTSAAGITDGRIFRPVTRGGVVKESAISDEKVVWRLVVRYARETELGKLAPHDLRRTCAKLCRKAGGDLEQIQLLLGHASVQTTERYLGTEQALVQAVNDPLGLDLGWSLGLRVMV